MSQGFALRPETDADIPFLARLYASTREAELEHAPWEPLSKLAFLLNQFEAQRRHYYAYYPDTAFDVIDLHSVPVGRLYLEARSGSYHIIDIALMPDMRGQGVGTQLLEGLLAHAGALGKGVGISVETFNPALHLYRRLGFTHISDEGIYQTMEWSPEPVVS
ncbi:GNAT family N-acetyltransferase [Sphingomonas sp.]|uniref:GNAT family N-acetyltransferase n=1 Tax=Sphingomonas sp. TaxID=28214 RepID=UPI002E2F5A3F|nr:GNAT family N-acetyltransferase [Sphingomonas sp.]HEX4695942.1 GNAT family N-acetyltransferase [Sphingomonas sp.]